MKLEIFLVSILFCTFFPSMGLAKLTCSNLYNLNKQSTLKKKKIEEVFSGYLTTDKATRRKMYVKIEKPSAGNPKEWLFLIHGLLDSNIGWQKLAEQALVKGKGVVRLDLNGHGLTLDKNSELNQGQDTVTDYQTNVSDVINVLKIIKNKYKIAMPFVVGHSYGGGIATAIAAHPIGKKLIGSELTLISPYVFRIDGFQTETVLNYFGGYPFLKLMRSFIPDNVQAQMEAATTDMYMNPIMQTVYREHFEKLLDERVPEYKVSNIKKLHDDNTDAYREKLLERTEIIDRNIRAAIDITKGIRDFDGRIVAEDLPSNIRVTLILGTKDQFNPRNLIIEFYQALKKDGVKVDLHELDTDHMMIDGDHRLILKSIDN